MHKLVIDASVALKWFPFGEEKQVVEARKIWEGIRSGEIVASAPTFMLVEVANILFKKKKIEIEIISEVIERIMSSEITFVDIEKYQLPSLIKLMAKHTLTGYDAQYVLIAKERHSKVVSSDGPMTQIKDLCIGLDSWK